LYLPQTPITKYIKLPLTLENNKIFKIYAQKKNTHLLIACLVMTSNCDKKMAPRIEFNDKGPRTIRPKIGPPQNNFILTHVVGLHLLSKRI